MDLDSIGYNMKVERTSRVDVRRSSDASADMSVVLREDASQAEVSNFWVEIFVQKNVARFDVTMHNTSVASLVQVCKTTGCSLENLQPCCPIHRQSWFICGRYVHGQKIRGSIRGSSLVVK